jgi:general secretion pathway protein H
VRAASPSSRRGIILLDVVLALAVIALIMLLALPALPRGTSAARHQAYALQIAAALKADRTAAARSAGTVATLINVGERRIVSGADGHQIALPRDLALNVLASDLCTVGPGRFAIAFTADGRSCGAVIRVSSSQRDWRIRINWLTGFVDVVAPDHG